MFKNKEYVLTVYREASFTKAAEKLFVSQPSLSATIRRIEEKIAATIFDRSTTPVTLTEVGKEYVKYALEIEEKERDFMRFTSDYAKHMTGAIRIGGSSFFSAFVLPKMISEFNKSYPKIKFEIFEDSTKNLMHALNEGRLDLVIDNAKIDDENIVSETYKPEIILLAVPKEFAINEKFKHKRLTAEQIKADEHLIKKNAVDLFAFNGLPFILLHHENDTGKRAEKLLGRRGTVPNVIFHLDQQVTAYNVSCTGMGISFVSDTLVKSMESSAALYFYAIDDVLAARKIYLYQKKNHYLSLACRKFIELNAKTDE